jgi:EpsI family protein
MLLQTGILIVVLLLSYAPVFRDLAAIWWSRDDYSHGFLILPISLYLVWARRSAFRQLRVKQGSLWGLALVLGASILLLLGTAGLAISLRGLSLVVMTVGLVLLLLGQAYLKVLAFPISYLLFMIPILDELLAPLQWPLQLFTARMAVRLLQLLGVSALVEQQYIVLPRTTLEVARVCSGANYLVSIIAIGLPLAYLTLRTWWSRSTLLLSAMAIGVIANWARVALIGVWASFGGEVLHGPFQIFRAMFVAWIGIAALVAGVWALSRMEQPATPSNAIKRFSAPPFAEGQPGRPVESNRSWRIALAVLAVLGVYMTLLDRGPVHLMEDLATFPGSFDGWSGKRGDLGDTIFRIEGADHELLRVYQNQKSQAIQLYVAYLTSQGQWKKIVDYRSAQLHEDAKVAGIKVGPGRIIAVNRGRLRGPRGECHIIFWYDIDGRIIADRYGAKLQTMWDALVYGRTNGAFVLLATDAADNTGTVAQMEAFARDLVPRLRSYLP